MLPAASRGAGRGWALGAVAREASPGRRDGPPPCCSSVSRETLPTASRAPAAVDIRGRWHARRRWAGATVRLRVARAFHVKRCRRRPERRPRPTLGGDGTRGNGGPARRSAFVLPRAFHVKRCRRPPGRRPRPRHEALSTEASSPGKTGLASRPRAFHVKRWRSGVRAPAGARTPGRWHETSTARRGRPRSFGPGRFT